MNEAKSGLKDLRRAEVMQDYFYCQILFFLFFAKFQRENPYKRLFGVKFALKLYEFANSGEAGLQSLILSLEKFHFDFYSAQAKNKQPQIGPVIGARSPFMGLSYFHEKDKEFFFGREKFTEELLKAIDEKPIVALAGASGSGKSSVVHAGVIPKLREQGYLIYKFRPGVNPYLAAVNALRISNTDTIERGNAIETRRDARRASSESTELGRSQLELGRAPRVPTGIDFINTLADKRLIVTGTNETGKQTLEVVHEALIREWKRLKEWINVDREFRVWKEKLRYAQAEWETQNREDGHLLRGSGITLAEDWYTKRKGNLSKREIKFIETSIQKRNLEVQARLNAEKKKKRVNRIITFISVAVCALFLLVGYSSLKSFYKSKCSNCCVEGDCVDSVGKYIVDSYASYEGHFLNGMPEGHGAATGIWIDGKYYQYFGKFKKGLFHGYGNIIFMAEENPESKIYQYSGGFENGKRHGQGSFYFFKEKIYFIGKFDQDKPVGEGIRYNSRTKELYKGRVKYVNDPEKGPMILANGRGKLIREEK